MNIADIAYGLGTLFGYAVVAILVVSGVVVLIRNLQRRKLPAQQLHQRLSSDDAQYPHDPPYSQPSPYGPSAMPPQPMNPPERSGAPALLGFIFSLVSILGTISNYSSFLLLLSIAGVILSSIGLRSRKRHGLAVAGLVISIIVLVIGAIYLIGFLAFLLSKH